MPYIPEYGDYIVRLHVAGRAIDCSIDTNVAVTSGVGLEMYLEDNAASIDCYVIERRNGGEYTAVAYYYDPDLADLDMNPFMNYVVCKATSFAHAIECIYHDLKKHLY